MAFNGSGVFNRLYNWTTDKANSIKIRADRMDAEIDGIATGLSTCITKDGQTTPTADLPMGGRKHTNVANGTARSHYAAVGQLQDATVQWGGTAAGTADAITLTLTPTLTAYAAGQRFAFISSGPNTGAVTLNIDAIGAKAVTKHGTTALAAGDIPSGAAVLVIYDGTQFQLLGIKTGTAAQKDTGTSGATVPLLDGANTWSAAQTFTANPTLQSSDAGAGAGPDLFLDRLSASPAANDVTGIIRFRGKDSGGNTDQYASIFSEIVDPTSGSEDGSVGINTRAGGSDGDRLRVRQGLYMQGATGGDPGTGKINAQDLQINGHALAQLLGAALSLDGTGTISIRASRNISGVVDNGPGSYTATFSTNMSSANWVAGINISQLTTDSTAGNWAVVDKAAGSFRIDCEDSGGAQVDAALIDVIIMGGLA